MEKQNKNFDWGKIVTAAMGKMQDKGNLLETVEESQNEIIITCLLDEVDKGVNPD